MAEAVVNPTIVVDDQGLVTREEWRLEDGGCHRVDGPAIRVWEVVDGRSVLICESWWLQGKRHRMDGPALRWCENEDNPLPEPFQHNERWYLHGKAVEAVGVYRAASTIRLWFLRHRARRERIISSLLEKDGMVVFPGLMGLLRRY